MVFDDTCLQIKKKSDTLLFKNNSGRDSMQTGNGRTEGGDVGGRRKDGTKCEDELRTDGDGITDKEDDKEPFFHFFEYTLFSFSLQDCLICC